MKLNRTKTIKIIFPVLFFLIYVWFCLSLVRTVFNLSKVYNEKELIFASDDTKRYEIFGELHSFLTFVGNNTPKNSEIEFIITNKDIDNRFYYLSYYYLYPRKMNFVSENQEIVLKNTYVITFGFISDNKAIKIDNYNLTATYIGKKYIGSIHKLK